MYDIRALLNIVLARTSEMYRHVWCRFSSQAIPEIVLCVLRAVQRGTEVE